MYVVLGATGNTGSVAAKTLLERGEKVRVVGRDAAKLAQLFPPGMQPGAEIVTADANDVAARTKAFTGARAAYVLLPPRAQDPELLASGDKMSTAITGASRTAGIAHG